MCMLIVQVAHTQLAIIWCSFGSKVKLRISLMWTEKDDREKTD